MPIDEAYAIPKRGQELLRLTVYGQPAGAGSKTAEPVGKRFHEKRDANGRLILIYRPSSKKTEPWMKAVAKEAAIAWAGRMPGDGALWLDVLFFELRPQAHYFQRKSGRVLRPEAPAYPHQTETHDVDKMRRAISDSLTNSHTIADDKRVIGGEAWKDYVENAAGVDEPQAIIRVGRMAHQLAEELDIYSPPPTDGQEALV